MTLLFLMSSHEAQRCLFPSFDKHVKQQGNTIESNKEILWRKWEGFEIIRMVQLVMQERCFGGDGVLCNNREQRLGAQVALFPHLSSRMTGLGAPAACVDTQVPQSWKLILRQMCRLRAASRRSRAPPPPSLDPPPPECSPLTSSLSHWMCDCVSDEALWRTEIREE